MPVPSVARRPRGGVLTVLAMTAVLASCGSAQLLEAGQAEPHFDAVISDVQDALGGLGYELVHAPATRSWERSEERRVGNECSYRREPNHESRKRTGAG